MQCRDILAQIAAMLGNAAGAKPTLSPNDFIPRREDSLIDDLEIERQQMILWAHKHNARLQ